MVRYFAEMIILLAEFKFKLLIDLMILIQGLSRLLALAVFAFVLSLWPKTTRRSQRSIVWTLESGITGIKSWLRHLTAV